MAETVVTPYLFFGGRCEEALDFYQHAVGAQREMLSRFNESPTPPPPGMLEPGFETKVMHTSFVVGATRIMASDGCDSRCNFSGFRLALSAGTEEEAHRYFAALSDGGKVEMPLQETFWARAYGMLTDKFGVEWMVMFLKTPPA